MKMITEYITVRAQRLFFGFPFLMFQPTDAEFCTGIEYMCLAKTVDHDGQDFAAVHPAKSKTDKLELAVRIF